MGSLCQFKKVTQGPPLSWSNVGLMTSHFIASQELDDTQVFIGWRRFTTRHRRLRLTDERPPVYARQRTCFPLNTPLSLS